MSNYLNLFTFFNSKDADHLEDNLSRAFALCMLHEPVFLDRVLASVLNPEDLDMIRKEPWDERDLQIDLQQSAKTFEGCQKLYAVACSPEPIDLNLINDYTINGAQNPVTDVSITLGDTCIIFEFKRVNADCGQQLKGQAEAIRAINKEVETEIVYGDFNWGKILQTVESANGYLSRISQASIFLSDFIQFVELRYAEWMPQRPMSQIPFPTSADSPEAKKLTKRLDVIKEKIANAEGFEHASYRGSYNRTTLKVEWGWTREVLVDYELDQTGKKQESIIISIFAGETKGQGYALYGKNVDFTKLPDSLNGANLDVIPYLKFRHFNSPIFSIYPSKAVSARTHRWEFFDAYARRYKQATWSDFEAMMDEKVSKDWRDSGYNDKVINSNRTYFDFSPGVLLKLRVPYETMQKKDGQSLEEVVEHLKECINEMRKLIEGAV